MDLWALVERVAFYPLLLSQLIEGGKAVKQRTLGSHLSGRVMKRWRQKSNRTEHEEWRELQQELHVRSEPGHGQKEKTRVSNRIKQEEAKGRQEQTGGLVLTAAASGKASE